ncbi:response regulator receiver protein [Beggiatoa sp. PS]|nr:response regulator receiver protein [Beggiatoa sp. PS]
MTTILIVDDSSENIELLMAVLNNIDYKFLTATTGKSAIEIVLSQKPDLILLDVVMPDMNGYEVCTILKANLTTKRIPIIFITAKDDEDDESKGFEVGAVDYITKPFRPTIIQARVKTHLKLKFAYEELERLWKKRPISRLQSLD